MHPYNEPVKIHYSIAFAVSFYCFLLSRYLCLEMCEKAVEDQSEALEYVRNYFKTQRMYKRAVENELPTLKLVPDHLKIQWMCERVVENEPYNLKICS